MPAAGRTVSIWAFAVCLSAVLVLCLTGQAKAGCGQEFRGAPQRSDIPGGAPLAIGDSVLADAVPQLVRDGFEADGMVCRQMSQGLEILKNRRSNIPRLVVLALGTNGEVSFHDVDEALALLGPHRILVLVTPHGSVVHSTPQVIRTAAAQHPQQILLLDWDRLAAANPSWLAPDGVHLGGSAGADGFAEMVASVLPYAAGTGEVQSAGSSDEPGAPETLQVPQATHRATHRHPAHQPTTPATTSPQSAPATKPSTGTVAPRRAKTDSPPASGGGHGILISLGTTLALVLAGGLVWWRRSAKGVPQVKS